MKFKIKPFDFYLFFATVFLIFLSFSVFPVYAESTHFPEPNPPTDEREPAGPPLIYPTPRTTAPTTEWTYHKTSDNAHPDANEQQRMWLMNRARANPTEEGIWLANLDDPDVKSAIIFNNVDLDLLQTEFAGIAPEPPAAFDVRLYNAAKAHSEDMIARDAQDHDNQFDRVISAGFDYTSLGGNVFSKAVNGVHAHAAFNIDWGGDDGTGMQTGRGHRVNLMSIERDYVNVGIAMVPESDESTWVGPLVATGNFAKADTSTADHFNRFIVGTVWEDLNCNDMYDVGEGISNVTVMPDHGTYYAVTCDSGGYSIPILSSGTYQVTFSGGGITGNTVKSVDVDQESVLLDFIQVDSVPDSEIMVTAEDLCVGSTVFADNSYPCATSWNWSFPSGSPSTSGGSDPSVTYASPGSYTATLTASNALGQGTIATKTINVYDSPASVCSVQTQNLNNNTGMGIRSVLFSDISHQSYSSVQDGGYQDLSCTNTTALMTGTEYSISVEVGDINAEFIEVFIDYNNNNAFDESERVFSSSNAKGVHSGMITTPQAPVMDTLLRMRVMSDLNTMATACSAPEYGQAEDYSVIFKSPASVPQIEISAPSATITANGDVSFTATYTNVDTISLDANDISLNRTGTADASVSVSGTGNTSRSILLSGIQGDGTLGISIAAGTGSSGAETTDGATSDAFTVDNTAPIVTISSPADNSTVNDNTPALVYSVAETNSGSTTVQVDGQTVNTVSGQSLPQLSDGVHNVSVSHTDLAGNQGIASSSFTVATIGDIDESGTVDLKDALIVLQILAGITPAESINTSAVIDSGNRIMMQDAVYILQFVAGMRNS